MKGENDWHPSTFAPRLQAVVRQTPQPSLRLLPEPSSTQPSFRRRPESSNTQPSFRRRPESRGGGGQLRNNCPRRRTWIPAFAGVTVGRLPVIFILVCGPQGYGQFRGSGSDDWGVPGFSLLLTTHQAGRLIRKPKSITIDLFYALSEIESGRQIIAQ